MLDSAAWKCVEAAPAIRFALEGRSGIRPRKVARRTTILAVEGRVLAHEDGRLWLGEGDEVAFAYTLPPVINLTPLVGARVHIALHHEPLPDGPMAQLATVSDESGVVRLLAHFGEANGQIHAVGRSRVRVALSQRAGGPIAFGTDHLQCLVHVGEHVSLRDDSGEYVMQLIARSQAGYAAYAIVARPMWRGRI